MLSNILLINKRISATDLKWIALITMIIDHVGGMWFGEFQIFRIIGRVAFPLYVFMIIQGYFYTKNFTKYAVRLGLLALVSEIPFDLYFSGSIINFDSQNVVFQLLLCLFWVKGFHENNNWFFKVSITIALAVLATLLRLDYLWLGIGYSFLFYLYIQDELNFNYLMILFLGVSISFFPILNVQIYAFLSLFVISIYNPNKKGYFKNSFFNSLDKYYYFSYPVQYLVIVIIAIILQMIFTL